MSQTNYPQHLSTIENQVYTLQTFKTFTKHICPSASQQSSGRERLRMRSLTVPKKVEHSGLCRVGSDNVLELVLIAFFGRRLLLSIRKPSSYRSILCTTTHEIVLVSSAFCGRRLLLSIRKPSSHQSIFYSISNAGFLFVLVSCCTKM